MPKPTFWSSFLTTFLLLLLMWAISGHCWHMTPNTWAYHHQNNNDHHPKGFKPDQLPTSLAQMKYPTAADLHRAQNSRHNCVHPFSGFLANNGKLMVDDTTNMTMARELVAGTTAVIWDNYRSFAWGPLTPDQSKRSAVEASVALSALITFHLMGWKDKEAEARYYVLEAITKKSSPPALELFPGLVTAYQLTGEWTFLRAASRIASSLADVWQLPKNTLCDRWPIEAITFYRERRGYGNYEDYQRSFAYCEQSMSWWRENNGGRNETASWLYYWTMVNFHRFTNFNYSSSLDRFNAWLANHETNVTVINHFNSTSPMLFISGSQVKVVQVEQADNNSADNQDNELDEIDKRRVAKNRKTKKEDDDEVDDEESEALVYLSEKEGEMEGVDCAYGATFLMTAQARRDTVLIGERQRPPSLLWTDWRLQSTGQNITETCRRATLANSAELAHQLPQKFYFAYDYSESAKKRNFSSPNKISGKGGTPEIEFQEPHSPSKSLVNSKEGTSKQVNLLPQLALSYLIAYRTTHDRNYREFVWEHFLALQDYIACQVEAGTGRLPNFQALVEGSSGLSAKELASTFFGQTMRYLFLAFEEEWTWPLSQYVITASGNPIKILPKSIE